jgi:uncharacterized membrane protein
MEFPPIPGWDGLHPLVIHFPVALLIVAPLFVVLGVLSGKRGKGLLFGALVLMALGTISAYVAVESGEAAAELAERTPEMTPVLAHHQALAERTRLVFTVLTAIFTVLVAFTGLRKRDMKRGMAFGIYGIFLALYAVGTIGLVNTAHNGGRLVHEFGVRALMPHPPGAANLK